MPTDSGTILWMQNGSRMCRFFELPYHGPNGVTPGGPDVRLTPPLTFKYIRGDGNCLFRCFSHIITGSQEHHLRIRQAIVHHMLHGVSMQLFHGVVLPQASDLDRAGTRSWNVRITSADDHAIGMQKYITGTRMDTICQLGHRH